MKKVLITYATMSGSTQEIAEYIHRELTSAGVEVEIQPCRAVADVSAYGAVVLGMPIYMFKLHKDGLHFLKRHQKQLMSLPVAVFAGGAYGANAEADSKEVQINLNGELAKLPWLKPVSVQLVGGRFDPARLRFPYNLIPALKNAPAEDARNWEEIGAWARSLHGQMGIAAPERGLA